VSGAAAVWTGDTATVNLAYSDVSFDPLQSWTIDWGDGTQPQTFDSSAASATHIFTSPGNFSIVASATNKDGTFAAAPFPITTYQSPTLTSGTLSLRGTSGDDTVSF